MDLAYTIEQDMLAESIQRFIATEYDLSNRKALVASDLGYSAQHWQTFAQLGWLGMTIPESYGGLGGDLVDTMIMFEEFGKALVLEPTLSSLVLFAGALELAGSDAQKHQHLPALGTGDLTGCLAYVESDAPTNFNQVSTTAVQAEDQYRLNGTKSVVLNAASADFIIVSARTDGQDDDPQGISLFLVPSNTEGLSRKDYPTVDGLRASEVTLDNVLIPASARLGAEGTASQTLNAVINRGILAISAEAVGAMEALYQSTIDYTKQREQFDHPLSEFQVVKHRLTEMFMKATMLLNQHSEDAQRNIHALKFLIGKTSRFVGQNAVQLHGGMGMTEDLAIAHYFKRLMMIDATFGHTDIHLEAFVQ
jgi:alkylation response protein AidB-like acyl-CoA dehydrogenase